jgi:glutamine cyclotransferase
LQGPEFIRCPGIIAPYRNRTPLFLLYGSAGAFIFCVAFCIEARNYARSNSATVMNRLFLLALSTFSLAACNGDKPGESVSEQPVEAAAPSTAAPKIEYSVTTRFPHDISLFTEGFLFHDGQLFESTGSPEDRPETRSLIGALDLKTGKLDVKAEIDGKKYFGEGISFLDGKLYQLTYQNKMGFIYDAKTFKQTGTFPYANAEGWSLTTDGTSLIMSDGTTKLTWINPADMKPFKTVDVTQDGAPLNNINELEWINGFIYANVWLTDKIVKIDPATGKVAGYLDLSSLSYEARNGNPQGDVLNGIAYNPATDKIYVTGKLWPNVYEISFPH